MKKKVILAVGTLLFTAAVSTFVYVSNERKSVDELLNANVEALTEGEIIVGTLCMVYRNSACTSLGVVYKEHIKV